MSNDISILAGEISPIHWHPESDIDFERFADACHALQQIESGHQYWIGDALIYGKEKYGEEYAQAIPDGKADTWRQYEWVCSRVPVEIRKHLTGYAQARIMARLTLERQQALVRECKPLALTSRALADEVRKITRLQANSNAKFPSGQFRIIYADPPWQYNDRRDGLPGEYSAPEDHYPTMPLQTICDMPIRQISDPDSVLFLWIPSPLLFSHAPAVLAAWQYEYKSMFVWDKDRHNPGNYNSVQHEILLIALRGQCQPADSYILRDSVQTIRVGKRHSEKPFEFREIIDEMYPDGNRIELFARCDLPEHWAKFGNQ